MVMFLVLLAKPLHPLGIFLPHGQSDASYGNILARIEVWQEHSQRMHQNRSVARIFPKDASE
jgi:hypothetical protein